RFQLRRIEPPLLEKLRLGAVGLNGLKALVDRIEQVRTRLVDADAEAIFGRDGETLFGSIGKLLGESSCQTGIGHEDIGPAGLQGSDTGVIVLVQRQVNLRLAGRLTLIALFRERFSLDSSGDFCRGCAADVVDRMNVLGVALLDERARGCLLVEDEIRLLRS